MTTWFGAGVGLVGTLLATPISLIVYGEQFGPTGDLLALLIWVLPLSFASGHARFSLLASGHQRLEFIAQTCGAIVTIGMCLYAVPRWGIGGAAIAMLVSATVVWVGAHSAFTRKVAKLPSIGPLVRPALALGAAFATAKALSLASPWTSTLAATGVFLLVGGLLELPFLRGLAVGADGADARE